MVRRQGYQVVLADRDTQDWAGPGVEEIVKRAVEGRPHAGVIVALQDGGGDRGQTVAAVEQIITRLSAQGYRFTTVSQAVGIPPAIIKVSTSQKIVAWTLMTAVRGSAWLEKALQVAFLAAAVLTFLRLGALLVFAKAHLKRSRRRRAERERGQAEPFTPWVSVIVPAYNEEAGIEATVRSLLDTDYPALRQVIVVDDGSTDHTAAVVEALGLPGVRLVRKPNGGKPSALNAGLAVTTAELVVLVDGDTVFQRDTIGNLVAPLADPVVGAVSGNTKVGNRKGILGRWQHLEYVIGFNLDRRMFEMLQCMSTIPGAIGAFRREVLTSLGGVSDDTMAEDTDLTMSIHRSGWRVVYESTAIAWTEAPSCLRQLWRQRYRWCYGTMQAMAKHSSSLIERGPSGRFGRRCLTYLIVFQVALPLFAPVVDILTLYALVVYLGTTQLAVYWLIYAAVGVLAGAYSLRMDGERLGSLWTLPFQQVVYRQLMYLVVIQSVTSAVLGTRLRWQSIRRNGTFTTGGGPATPAIDKMRQPGPP